MKKIVYALNPLKFKIRNLDFISFICRQADSSLHVVFFENNMVDDIPDAIIKQAAMDMGIDDISKDLEALKQKISSANMLRFKTAWDNYGIPCYMHRNCNSPMEEMVLESRYADLIILDLSLSFSSHDESVPSDFVRKYLHHAECPVIILPVSFHGIEEIVFTYDGGESSIYAIKQFTHLFPMLSAYKAVVISINPDNIEMEEKYKFREWMHGHYKSIDFQTTAGNVGHGLVEMLHNRANVLIVLGAYGRSFISSFFNPSHADPVLKWVGQAIFIAHH